MDLTQAPYNWNSLWRPIEYIYDYKTKVTNSIGNNGGYAQFNFASVFSPNPTPAVGERFIVENTTSPYYGIHEITSVDSTTQFTVASLYTVGAGAVTVKHVRLPEIKLYKGYLSGEAYYDDDPATLVATFTPKNSIYNDIRIDVSGYLQGSFSLSAPTEGIDHNLFSRFRLYFDGAYQRYYHVLNSGLDGSDVDAYYANTGRYLTSAELPYLQDCGTTLLCRIQDDAVLCTEFASTGLEGGEFDTDFDTDFET